MNQWKSAHAVETKARTLAEAIEGADVFFGLSAKGAVDQAMVRSMADKPIIFAMANPDPEITPEEVRAVRSDAIIATGRSDYPEPGQQRSRVSLHLSRRARRARLDDQRRDEDRRGRSLGRARARGRAGRGRRRLFRRAPALRAGLHHPGAVRPAADLGGAVGGRQGGDGFRRRAQAHSRHGRLQAQPARAPRPDRRRARADLRAGPRRSRSASSSPRARKRRRSAPHCCSPKAATARRCWSAARNGSSRRCRRWG